MLKDILKRYRLHMTTLYMTLGMIWGMALFGIILFEIIMQVAIHNGKEPETFQMAFLMAFIMYFGAAIFAGGISSYTSFNISISMGCTRKHYIIMRTIFLLISNLLGLLSVCAIYGLEMLYLNWHWKGYTLEVDLHFLMNPLLLFILWIAGTILPFFISALTLRFGKVISIITYTIWLIGCLSFAHIDEFIHSENPLLLVRIFQTLQPYQWSLILIAICAVLYMITYRIYKKQAVVA